MVIASNFHPVHSIDPNNVPTQYFLRVTNKSGETVFEGSALTQRNYKAGLVAMLQNAGENLFDIVGDGEVDYKSKAFVFTGDRGVFYAKLVKYSN